MKIRSVGTRNAVIKQRFKKLWNKGYSLGDIRKKLNITSEYAQDLYFNQKVK